MKLSITTKPDVVVVLGRYHLKKNPRLYKKAFGRTPEKKTDGNGHTLVVDFWCFSDFFIDPYTNETHLRIIYISDKNVLSHDSKIIPKKLELFFQTILKTNP